MNEAHAIWDQHYKSLLKADFYNWEVSANIDLEEGNPIYALYNPVTLKAIRVIQGDVSDYDLYGVWVKRTSMGDMADSSISEFVFRYRTLSDSVLEVYRILFTIWIAPNTDYEYMESLIDRFQRPHSEMSNQ